ncbi:MAG: 1,4-dihydroxy-2-naphthoate octaprenyltransferase [Flavobacteriaceae bacterium]
MTSIKYYIQAARLRTLPLSVSGIIVAAGIAASEQAFNLVIFVLALLATIGFQVVSNFANDYGDGVKGTDSNRNGEQRMIASGLISPQQMKLAILCTIIITMLIVIALIYLAFGKDNFINSLVFFGLGISSIIAAIKYTVGKSAYGYSGFGDVFVFVFFGLLSVIGGYYLFSQQITSYSIVLPASAIGLLSTAVLNLNNMRDQIQDKTANKNTLVVKLGPNASKVYHCVLILIALVLLITYRVMTNSISLNYWWFLLAFIPLILNVITVFKTSEFADLDAELKKVALSTFFCAILFCIPLFY